MPTEGVATRVAGMIGDPVLRLRFLKVLTPSPAPKRRFRYWMAAPALLLVVTSILWAKHALAKPKPQHAVLTREQLPPLHEVGLPASVWLVEKSAGSEVYSNGLRIDTQFQVNTHPRSYLAFPAAEGAAPVRRSMPVGIVFHTTESPQAPFESSATPVLTRLGESLLEFVRRKAAYHYLIDRFGRVFRVVAESDAANHAGYSVWADDNWRYVNLNESFLGVSFEARTPGSPDEPAASPAQIRSVGMLTEMLRSIYQIPAANCVTHAQVSVNPANMRIGYHTDWTTGFPFTALGLPDNYVRDLPALSTFGFEIDPGTYDSPTQRISVGVALAQEDFERAAASATLAPADYRKLLKQRYQAYLSQVHGTHPAQPEEGDK
jgi:N-acetylmuramoyl-L-alanine amidase